jgi:biotin carboxyl carrier protein
MNVQARINPLDNDDLILCDDGWMQNVDYYIDENNRVTQLDYEGEPMSLQVKGSQLVTEEEESGAAAAAATAKIVSPMPGTVTKVFCEAGQKVSVGDTLISVESMKMEYLVKAKADGEVEKVFVGVADVVGMKQTLVMMK